MSKILPLFGNRYGGNRERVRVSEFISSFWIVTTYARIAIGTLVIDIQTTINSTVVVTEEGKKYAQKITQITGSMAQIFVDVA